MNARLQRVCIWAGPTTFALFLIGYLLLADLVPPIAPSDTAAEVAARYSQDQDRLRAGLSVVIFCAPLLYAWVAAMHTQLKRVGGPDSPLATTFLMGGMTLVLFLFLPCMVLGAAAFRPERAPEVTQGINDVGWLLFIGPAGPAVVMAVVMGVAMLLDRARRPAFPRWVGYFNIWAGISFTGAAFVWLFQDGPFAWNGLFPFWLPLVFFGLWIAINTWALLQAVAGQEVSAQATPADEPAPPLSINV